MVGHNFTKIGLGTYKEPPPELPPGWRMIFPVFCTADMNPEILDTFLQKSYSESHPRQMACILRSAERPSSRPDIRSVVPQAAISSPFPDQDPPALYKLFKEKFRREDRYDSSSVDYWTYHTFIVLDSETIKDGRTCLVCTDESGELEAIRADFPIGLFQAGAFELEASSVAYIQYMFVDRAKADPKVLTLENYNSFWNTPQGGTILEYTANNGARYEMLMGEGEGGDGSKVETGLLRALGEKKWRRARGTIRTENEWAEIRRNQGIGTVFEDGVFEDIDAPAADSGKTWDTVSSPRPG